MLTLDDDFSLSETKVAMWAACESANNNNDKGISFAQYAQSKGAKSSIGFSVDISCSASRKFTNFFFMELAMGRSVLEAAQFGASRLNWAWDNGNCKIFGDTATKVTTNTGSNVSFMPRTPISKKQLTELKSPAYISHDLGFNIKRYYKTINGYISDEYVDLYSDTSNQPSYMKKHHTNAKSVLPIRKDVLSKYVISLPRINREESHIVYCNFNQKMTPILLGYQRIHEGKKASRNVRCINLYDGLPVDYKKIV